MSSDSLPREAIAAQAQPYPYPDAPSGGKPGSPFASTGLLSDPRLSEEIARREQAARELGRAEGKAEAQAALETERARLPEAIAQTVTAFAREREAFYQKVEPEVVQLALGIARKVLYREAQVDSLLLAGMVRVALEGIEFSTRVTVRLHPRLLPSFREYFAQHIDPSDLPELLEDPTLDEHRCILETHLGKTELGWDVQLKEIEQGLLDLLGHRPPAAL